jgi:hypothetical protein
MRVISAPLMATGSSRDFPHSFAFMWYVQALDYTAFYSGDKRVPEFIIKQKCKVVIFRNSLIYLNKLSLLISKL